MFKVVLVVEYLVDISQTAS